MAKNYFNRYVWLIDQIHRHGHITKKELDEAWSRSSLNDLREDKIPERTFFNHIIAIADTFGLDIKCDRALGYYIENDDDMNGNSLTKWMLNSLSLRNLVNESVSVKDRIIVDDVPSGEVWLTEISRAMTESKTVRMTYHSFYRPEASTFDLQPWCLRLFRQRWYVLGLSEGYSDPRIYALDRIENLEATSGKFTLPSGFNASEYFNDIVGVSVGDCDNVVDVKLMVDPYQANYLRSLPLHHSQREIETTKDYVVFYYHLAPTFEFKQAVLSLMDTAEILEPQSLRSELAEIVSKMHEAYHK